jgi:glycosyltransferase involved in cell wall biosynthesis
MVALSTKNRLVDIVIPAFNAEHYIDQTLESIALQGDLVHSIIVVNDGSTDQTAQIVEAFTKKHPHISMKLIHQNNAGLANARNIGIQQATASYIALLDADDIWLNGKLEQQLKVFNASPEPRLGVVYTGYELIDENSLLISNDKGIIKPQARGDVRSKLLTGNFISGSGSSVLIKAEVFREVGLFDESLRASEDWDMWLRIAQKFHFDFVDAPLVQIRVHQSNMQKDFSRMLASELAMLNKFAQQGKHNYFLLLKIQTILFKKNMSAQEITGFDVSEPWVRKQLTGYQHFIWQSLLYAPNAIWDPLKKLKRFIFN